MNLAHEFEDALEIERALDSGNYPKPKCEISREENHNEKDITEQST